MFVARAGRRRTGSGRVGRGRRGEVDQRQVDAAPGLGLDAPWAIWRTEPSLNGDETGNLTNLGRRCRHGDRPVGSALNRIRYRRYCTDITGYNMVQSTITQHNTQRNTLNWK